MRKLPSDITNEMKIRFGSEFQRAKALLDKYICENDYLDSDRIIRCIIYLSDNGIKSFKSNLEAAQTDPRDVMYFAEYENRESFEECKWVRNFNNSF